MDSTEDDVMYVDLVGSNMKKTEDEDENTITDNELNDYYDKATDDYRVTEWINDKNVWQ